MGLSFHLFIFSYFLITGKTKLSIAVPKKEIKCKVILKKSWPQCDSLDMIKMRRPLESFVSYKIMILLNIVYRKKVLAYEIAVNAAQPKK